MLDANIIVSSLLSHSGPAGRVVQLSLRGEDQLLTTGPILAEYGRAIRYPKVRHRHNLDDADLDVFMHGLDQISEQVVTRSEQISFSVDPADDEYLVCAATANADCVVSGDRHLRVIQSYAGIPILSPAEYLKWRESESNHL